MPTLSLLVAYQVAVIRPGWSRLELTALILHAMAAGPTEAPDTLSTVASIDVTPQD